MINENDVKQQITRNLIYYRKKKGLTQQEVASKISYSDKAISKWERGLGLPDVLVLAQLADVYGTTLEEMVSPKTHEEIENSKQELDDLVKQKKRRLIAYIAVFLVWLVAAVAYFTFKMIFPNEKQLYLIFIYAIPASFVVALVFNILWGRVKYNAVYESLLSWTLAFSIILNASKLNVPYIWYLLLIPLTFQSLIILWNMLLNTGRIFGSKKNKE